MDHSSEGALAWEAASFLPLFLALLSGFLRHNVDPPMPRWRGRCVSKSFLSTQ